jgi:hypothetical protein
MTALDILDSLEVKALLSLRHAFGHRHRSPKYWEGQIDALREVICDVNDLRLKLVGLKEESKEPLRENA